ncbi:hypothetical protein PCL_10810 [Purpureocillium lilacinum]|uniref:Uncharacterized protein n=1 Tax=Purpureocillium lilacinum TaxID=33203 RepID=A0A2U3ECF3_PURLI|nr:hypothetical protein PCL_10810 [Purpureocillium lilacinum]
MGNHRAMQAAILPTWRSKGPPEASAARPEPDPRRTGEARAGHRVLQADRPWDERAGEVGSGRRPERAVALVDDRQTDRQTGSMVAARPWSTTIVRGNSPGSYIRAMAQCDLMHAPSSSNKRARTIG